MVEFRTNKDLITNFVKILNNACMSAEAYGIEKEYKIYNGFHTNFTDELYKKLDVLCSDTNGLKSHIFKRGQWQLLYVLDENNKCVYSFMSEFTYKKTAKKIGKMPHYLQATLIMQNNNTGKLQKYIVTKPTIEDFLNDFDTDNIGEKKIIEDVYNSIYGNLADAMKQYTHFIVVYKKSKKDIVYANLVLHNSENNKTMKMQIFHRDSDFVYEDTVNNTEDKVFIKESQIHTDSLPKVTIKAISDISSK